MSRFVVQGKLFKTSVWYESYRSAALETNWRVLPGRIIRAEFDMHDRLDSLPSSYVNEGLQIAMGLSGLIGLTGDLLLWQDGLRAEWNKRLQATRENLRCGTA